MNRLLRNETRQCLISWGGGFGGELVVQGLGQAVEPGHFRAVPLLLLPGEHVPARTLRWGMPFHQGGGPCRGGGPRAGRVMFPLAIGGRRCLVCRHA